MAAASLAPKVFLYIDQLPQLHGRKVYNPPVILHRSQCPDLINADKPQTATKGMSTQVGKVGKRTKASRGFGMWQ